jgi:hypothetical protein
MTFFRSLFFNFLAVFVMARITPGLEIDMYDKVPNIGGSLLFALIVGLLNASVFPLLFLLEILPSKKKIAVLTGIISFVSFIVVLFVPFGVRAMSFVGVILGGGVVWAVAFLTNYFEWHRGAKNP